MATTTSIDLQAGRYHGDDLEAVKAFGEIQTNWTRLKNTLTSGGLPSLMAKITSGYSAGYSWVEMYEAAAGTFAVLSGGRVSGAGGWPKAFEANGGTADFTNDIVELLPSTDVTTGTTTVSFDAHGPRLAGNDLKALPSTPTFVAGMLTIPYNTLQFDINGKSVGAASGNWTVAITGTGGVDCDNSGVATVAAASFINLPASINSVLQFTANGLGADLVFAGASDRQGAFYDASAGQWKIDFVRGHT